MGKILSFADFINEGGNVFKHETRRVSATEAQATIKHLYTHLIEKLEMQKDENIMTVGSGSAGTEAGDLDFVYDIKEMRKRLGSENAENRFYDRVKMETDKLELKAEFLKGFGITSIEYPVAGEKDKGYVQVDFIPVEGMDWARFTYEQSKGSKYKSAHRNWLLAALCASKRDDEKVVDDELISWAGYMFDIQRGFFRVRKTRAGVNGNLLKNPKKEESNLVSTDPDKFLEFAFTDPPQMDDIASFEGCWRIIKNDDRWKSKMERIAKELEKFLKRADLEVPEEIKEFL